MAPQQCQSILQETPNSPGTNKREKHIFQKETAVPFIPLVSQAAQPWASAYLMDGGPGFGGSCHTMPAGDPTETVDSSLFKIPAWVTSPLGPKFTPAKRGPTEQRLCGCRALCRTAHARPKPRDRSWLHACAIAHCGRDLEERRHSGTQKRSRCHEVEKRGQGKKGGEGNERVCNNKHLSNINTAMEKKLTEES